MSGRKVCIYFQAGNCRFGNDCKFFHPSDAATRQVRPRFSAASSMDLQRVGLDSNPRNDTNKKDCMFFKVGKCTRGSECDFFHDLAAHGRPNQVRPRFSAASSMDLQRVGLDSNPRNDTNKKDCMFFKVGKCTRGNDCEFFHDLAAHGRPNKGKGHVNSGKGFQGSSKFNNKMFVIRNLSPDDPEDVRNLFRNLSGKDPLTIRFSHDKTAAMAGFREALDIDILRQDLQRMNCNMQLEEVPFCKTIALHGFPPSTTEDDIVSAVRRVSGPLSIANVDYSDGNDFAIITFTNTSDVGIFRDATVKIGTTTVSYFYYNDDFLTREMYEIIHGRTKKITFKVNKNLLDYIIKKANSRLQLVLGLQKYETMSCGGVYDLVVTVEDYTSSIEAAIRKRFTEFISEYDTVEIRASPKILGISKASFHDLCLSFVTKEDKCNVAQWKEGLYVTGKKEEVAKAVHRFEKAKAERQLAEKKMAQSKSLSNFADLIMQQYPVFNKNCVMDWLKTSKGSREMQLSAKRNGFPVIKDSEKAYTEKEQIAFFKTEAFESCRHRILKECSAALAVERRNEPDQSTKIPFGVSIEVFIGNITAVKSDVIVNSTAGKVGTGNSLAKALYTVAGTGCQLQWAISYNNNITKWEYLRTPGGHLNCMEIFHVHLGSYNAHRLERLVTSILDDVEKTGYSSVAFPLIGTGALQYSKEDVVTVLTKCVEEFRSRKPVSTLRKVIIVALDTDEEAVRIVKRHNSPKMSESVVVTILGFERKEIADAQRILDKCFNEQIIDKLPAYVNDESLQLPSNWDKMPVDSSGIEKPFHTFPLPSTSREYKDVEQEVLRTGLGRIHQILTISRIQNPQLYIPYAVRKAAMDKANRSTNNERMLFHGTSPKCCEAISHYGFNRSFAGTHAAAYGDGNYFAVNSSYSAAYSKPNGSRERFMFMAKVLVGEFTAGSRKLKTPPKKGNETDLYDSVVDNIQNPSIFVVFPDNQSYPDYLICFF